MNCGSFSGLGSQPESEGFASAVALSSAANEGLGGGGADSPAAAMEGQLAAMRAQFAARQATPEVPQLPTLFVHHFSRARVLCKRRRQRGSPRTMATDFPLFFGGGGRSVELEWTFGMNFWLR